MTVATNTLSQTAKNALAASLANRAAAAQIQDILEGDVTTLSIGTADALKVGGVIVPTGEILVSETIPLHASKVIYNLFTAREAWQVTHIDYVPDVAQGGALTATVVKAVGTDTPASATTPMHTAGAINLNGTAHTVQPITLSATTADLQLAAGGRIAIVLSAAMTTGNGHLTVRGKRI